MKYVGLLRVGLTLLMMICAFGPMAFPEVRLDDPSFLAPESFTKSDREQEQFWKDVLGDTLCRGLNISNSQADELADEIWTETVMMLQHRRFPRKKILAVLSEFIDGLQPVKTADGNILLLSHANARRYTLTIGFNREKNLRPAWQLNPSLPDKKQELRYPFSLADTQRKSIILKLSLFFALSSRQADQLTEDQIRAMERVIRRSFFAGDDIGGALSADTLCKKRGLLFYRHKENPLPLFLGDPQQPDQDYSFHGTDGLTGDAVLGMIKIPPQVQGHPLAAPYRLLDWKVVKQILIQKVLPRISQDNRAALKTLLETSAFEGLVEGQRLSVDYALAGTVDAVLCLKEILLTINAMTGLQLVTGDIVDHSTIMPNAALHEIQIINPGCFKFLGEPRDFDGSRALLAAARESDLPLESMSQAFLLNREVKPGLQSPEPYTILLSTNTEKRLWGVARLVPAILENARLFHRQVRVLVLDDRRQPDPAIREQFSHRDAEHGIVVEYLDRRAQEAFLRDFELAVPAALRRQLLQRPYGTLKSISGLKVFSPGITSSGNRCFGIVSVLLGRMDPAKGSIVIPMDDDMMPESSISYGWEKDAPPTRVSVDFLPALVNPILEDPSTVATFPVHLGIPDVEAFVQQEAPFASLAIENISSDTVQDILGLSFGEKPYHGDVTALAVHHEQALPYFNIPRAEDAFLSPLLESLLRKDRLHPKRNSKPVVLVSLAMTHDADQAGRNYEAHFTQELFLLLRPFIIDYVDRAIAQIPSEKDSYRNRYEAMMEGLRRLREDLERPHDLAITKMKASSERPAGKIQKATLDNVIRAHLLRANLMGGVIPRKFRADADSMMDVSWQIDSDVYQEVIADMKSNLQTVVDTLEEWRLLMQAIDCVSQVRISSMGPPSEVRAVDSAL